MPITFNGWTLEIIEADDKNTATGVFIRRHTHVARHETKGVRSGFWSSYTLIPDFCFFVLADMDFPDGLWTEADVLKTATTELSEFRISELRFCSEREAVKRILNRMLGTSAKYGLPVETSLTRLHSVVSRNYPAIEKATRHWLSPEQINGFVRGRSVARVRDDCLFRLNSLTIKPKG